MPCRPHRRQRRQDEGFRRRGRLSRPQGPSLQQEIQEEKDYFERSFSRSRRHSRCSSCTGFIT